MVLGIIAEKSNPQEQVSELQVLRSAAGYYIGRTYYDEEWQEWLPYTRESLDYYRTKFEAQEKLHNKTYRRRDYL